MPLNHTVHIKLDDKGFQTFKEARAQAIIEEKDIGEWLVEAIEEKFKHDDQLNS